jgi:hypothetical protein
LRHKARNAPFPAPTQGEAPRNGTLAPDTLRDHKLTCTLAFDQWRFLGEQTNVRLTHAGTILKMDFEW